MKSFQLFWGFHIFSIIGWFINLHCLFSHRDRSIASSYVSRLAARWTSPNTSVHNKLWSLAPRCSCGPSCLKSLPHTAGSEEIFSTLWLASLALHYIQTRLSAVLRLIAPPLLCRCGSNWASLKCCPPVSVRSDSHPLPPTDRHSGFFPGSFFTLITFERVCGTWKQVFPLSLNSVSWSVQLFKSHQWPD